MRLAKTNKIGITEEKVKGKRSRRKIVWQKFGEKVDRERRMETGIKIRRVTDRNNKVGGIFKYKSRFVAHVVLKVKTNMEEERNIERRG